MTSSRPLLSLAALLLAGSVAGCDTESSDLESRDAELSDVESAAAEAPAAESPAVASLAARLVDHRVAGRVDVRAVLGAPWLAGALEEGELVADTKQELGRKFGACADVLWQADSITFGAKDEAFEVYVEGAFEAADANACSDHIDTELGRHAERLEGHPKPEAVLLAEGVFVVFGGELTPSRERLAGLQAADPSGGEPLWVLANLAGEGHPVEQVAAWANPAKGVRAHAEVVFTDAQKASEIYGKATLGLTALSLSGEVGELASAVELGSSGKTMTANVELTQDQIGALVTHAKAKHEAHFELHGGHGHEHGDSGVKIEISAD